MYLYFFILFFHGYKEKNISTALNVIKKIGGWPVLEGNLWQDKNYQWEETIYNLKAEGLSISSLFSLSLESNFMNEDQFVLNVQNLFKKQINNY